jgi:hypothetical protein
MAEHEPDGVNEAFMASARVALTAGGLMAERMIRAREQALRDAQAQGEQHARELQTRIAGERAAARASLRPAGLAAWWERASSEQLGVAWETANAWRDLDADAARTVDHMRNELRARYAIDPDSLGADPGAVQDALDRRQRALRLAAEARQQARLEDAVAAPLLVSAAVADRNQERDQAGRHDGRDDGTRGDALYDSAERRRELASELEGIADDETVEARVVADTGHAHPAQDAASDGPTRAPRARRSRGRSTQARSPRRSDRGR